MNDSDGFLMLIASGARTIKTFESSGRYIADESNVISGDEAFWPEDLRVGEDAVP